MLHCGYWRVFIAQQNCCTSSHIINIGHFLPKATQSLWVFLFSRRSGSSSAELETLSGHFKMVLRLFQQENVQSGLRSVGLTVVCEPPKRPPL